MITYEPFYMSSVYVSLTDDEYQEAWDDGVRIFNSSQKRNLKDNRPGEGGQRAQSLGCVAERAVAKFFSFPWKSSMDTFQNPDLPYNIQARLIGDDRYGLRVYHKDKNQKVVGVVIPKGKEREPYRIAGWIPAQMAHKNEWEMDPNNKGLPFWGVPQKDLFSVFWLRFIIENQDAVKWLMTNSEISFIKKLFKTNGKLESLSELL